MARQGLFVSTLTVWARLDPLFRESSSCRPHPNRSDTISPRPSVDVLGEVSERAKLGISESPQNTWFAPRGGVDWEPPLEHSYRLVWRRTDVAQRIRKGDLVQVMTGADRGKQGRVISVNPKQGVLRIEKVRLQKRHLKAGRSGARTGGIIEREGYVDASNVMLVDPTTNQPSRVRVKSEDGNRVRVFAKSGEAVPEPTGS